MIVNLELGPRELLGPTNLSKAEILDIYQPLEVVLIDENKDLIFAALYVAMLSVKGINNSKKLLIMSLVISFGKYHFSRKKSY